MDRDYAHWLPLILADRVGVVEGVLRDLSRGGVISTWNEDGRETKYNRNNFVVKGGFGDRSSGVGSYINLSQLQA